MSPGFSVSSNGHTLRQNLNGVWYYIDIFNSRHGLCRRWQNIHSPLRVLSLLSFHFSWMKENKGKMLPTGSHFTQQHSALGSVLSKAKMVSL